MTLEMGAILCIVAGAITVAVGVLVFVPATRFALAATASADGTGVGHELADMTEAIRHYPRVVFTAAGREWEIRGQLGYLRPQPAFGTRVRVYFPPNNPGAAELGGLVECGQLPGWWLLG